MQDQHDVHRLGSNAEAMLHALTVRQHVRPHQALRDATLVAAQQTGICEQVLDRAMAWLGIDPSTAIGRLRRTELTQLARCIDRYARFAQRQPQAW